MKVKRAPKIRKMFRNRIDKTDKDTRLGMRYLFGSGGSNKGKALECFMRSANDCNPSGQYALASYYRGYFGDKVDIEKAIYWLNKSVENGNIGAYQDLAEIYYEGEGGVDVDCKKAFEYYCLASKEVSFCMFMKGFFYFHGEVVKQDNNKAAECFKLALRKNKYCLNAAYCLGDCYREGFGVRKDLKKAFHYYKLAAEGGFIPGQHDLGVMYLIGDGVNKDVYMAKYWLNKAAQSGLLQSQELLNGLDKWGKSLNEITHLKIVEIFPSNQSHYKH